MKKPSGKNRARPAGGGDLKAKLEKYGITFDTLSMSHGISKYSWLIAWVVVGRSSPDTAPDDPLLLGAIEEVLA